MKPIKTILFAAALAVAALSSCDENNGSEINSNNVVKFNGSINDITRVSGTEWESGDAIGVFAKKTGQLLDATNTLYQNKKYTTDATGLFTNATEADAITYQDDQSFDFVAYYPYTAITGFSTAVSVATQSPQKNIDLMYSRNATAHSNTNAAVALTFARVLSKIVVNVTDESGANLSVMSSVVKGMKTQSTFSLVTGTLVDDAASVADITARTTANGATASVEAVVLPANTLTGATVVFSVGAKSYTLAIPGNTTYQGGKKYLYTASFKTTGEVVLSGSATIENWTDVPSGHQDLTEDGAVSGNDGSQASPFTVGEVAAHLGSNAMWVTGYVVGTTANTRAGESFTAPFSNKTNILIAASASENNVANCIVIALDNNATLQARLNLVDHADILKTQISVKGNIVASIMGYNGLDNITAEVGGKDPQTQGGTGEQYFFENFSNTDIGTTKYTIANFTNWNVKTVVYSDSYNKADLRQTTTMPIAIWFPSTGNSEFKIAGLDGSRTNVKLSLLMAAQAAETQAGSIQLFCNGTLNAQQMNHTFAASNTFVKIENISIPDGTTELKFFSDITLNLKGFRIREIELVGTK